MQIRAAILALAFILGGCAEDPVVRPDGDASQAVVLELRAGEARPTAVLTSAGEEQDGLLGTHCWAMRCVDFTGPPTPTTFTRVPGDSVVEIRGDGRIETFAVAVPPDEEYGQPVDEQRLRVRGGRTRLQLAPGRYMLIAFASWPEGGDAVFSFGIQVPS